MSNILNLFFKKIEEKSISFAFEGEIKRRRSEYKSALNYFNKAILLDSKNADFYMLRALTKKELSKLNSALKDIDKAIAINKSYNWYHIHRYTIKNALGYKDEAKKELLIVEQNEDNNLDTLYDYLAELELKEQNTQDAIFFLERALLKNKKNERLLAKKINLLKSIGKKDEAYKDAAMLIDLNVNHPEYYHIKSTVCYDMKSYEEAVVLSNKAIELCTSNHGYYAHRARSYNELKKYSEALQDIEIALNLDNNNPFYKELKNSLLKSIESTLES